MSCAPCKTNSCDIPDDFLTYSLQNPEAENPSSDPTDTTPCSPCKSRSCDEEPEDLTTYSLQTNIIYNTDPITVTVPCPYGWTCGETVTVTYPPGTFIVPDPNGDLYLAQGCLGLISASSAEELFQLLAAQQASCDTITNPPTTWNPPTTPPQPPPAHTWKNEPVYIVIPCGTYESLSFTGTAPSWISVDTGTFTVIGSAGVFASDVSQADANSRAQSALSDWVNSALGDGSLTCTPPFENVLQMVECPPGTVDGIGTYTKAIDGDGIYAIDGVVYVRAGYYRSSVSQAAADALALAAAQAWFDAVEATNQIVCDDCLVLTWGADSRPNPATPPAYCAGFPKTKSNSASNNVVSTVMTAPCAFADGEDLRVQRDAVMTCVAGRTYRVTVTLVGNVGTAPSFPNTNTFWCKVTLLGGVSGTISALQSGTRFTGPLNLSSSGTFVTTGANVTLRFFGEAYNFANGSLTYTVEVNRVP